MAKRSKRVNKSQNSTKYNVPTNTNLNPSTSRMKLGSYSLPSLKQTMGQIQEEIRSELRFPQASKIYKQMEMNGDINSALALVEALISKSKWKVVCPNDAPQEEKDRADKLNYNIKVMDRPFPEYISEFLSLLTYGFSTPEKIYKKMETPVGDFTGWKDFRPISQDSVKEWIFEKSTGDLSGLKQDLSLLNTTNLLSLQDGQTTVEIPRKKFLLFRNNSKRNNPEGVSPLRGCYTDWRYLSLIEEFETIYATKGLGGVLELGLDVAYLAKATEDPTGTEAQVLEEMRRGAANFHNGEQAYIETPLAYDDHGKPLFSTKILETTPPDTDKIIKRHSHRLLQCFFADILQLGANGSGSFALSDNKDTLLQIGVLHHLETIKNTLNHDLIPQTYELNGWDFDARTVCRFEYTEIDDGDIQAFAKAVQNVLATNAVDRTEDIEDVVRNKIFDLPPRSEANTKVRDVGEGQSRSGDGLESGLPNGVGESTSEGGDPTSSNVDNN